MELSKIEELMAKKDAGQSKWGMRQQENFIKEKNVKLKKEKVEIGSSGIRIYPLELRFPFNPINLSDKSFSSDNPFAMPTSPSSAVFYIKSVMRGNEELHEYFAKHGGMKKEEYDISLPADGKDVITKLDRKVFDKYRKLLHYSLPVQNYKFSSFGKFGRKYISEVKYNENGDVVEKDLGFMIAEFIGALSFNKQDMIAADYEAVNKYTNKPGTKFGKPESDMKAEQKLVRDSKKVQFPYQLGSLRYLILPSDKEYALTRETADTIKKDGARGLKTFDVYGNGGKNNFSKISEIIGSKNDVDFDFLQAGISYPEVSDADKGQELLTSIQRKDFQSKFSDHVDADGTQVFERVSSLIPNFAQIYRDYRDDLDNFSDDTMRKSVREYRKADEKTLLEALKEDLGSMQDLITEEIVKTYGSLIKKTDTALSSSVLEGIMEGTISKGVKPLTLDDLVKEGKVDEEMKGYGINMVDESTKELNLALDDDE